jgi:Ras-related protein Rab-7A
LITLQIWDTAGQERFQSLGQAFYRGADACVLVYDVQSVASFDKLEGLREQFIRHADISDPADFPFIVLGNKVDVDAKRQAVDQAKVKAWCESKGNIPHFLVSAKDGTNVETGFLTVVTAAAKRIKHEDPILPDTVRLELTKKKDDGCAC